MDVLSFAIKNPVAALFAQLLQHGIDARSPIEYVTLEPGISYLSLETAPLQRERRACLDRRHTEASGKHSTGERGDVVKDQVRWVFSIEGSDCRESHSSELCNSGSERVPMLRNRFRCEVARIWRFDHLSSGFPRSSGKSTRCRVSDSVPSSCEHRN